MRDDPTEVAITVPVRSQQSQMITTLEGQLCPQDWFDPFLFGLMEELHSAIESIMVGEGQGRHAAAAGSVDELVERSGAVKKTVVRMAMEMSKRHEENPKSQ